MHYCHRNHDPSLQSQRVLKTKNDKYRNGLSLLNSCFNYHGHTWCYCQDNRHLSAIVEVETWVRAKDGYSKTEDYERV